MRTILELSVEDIEKRRFPDKHYEYVVRVHWSDGTVNVVCRRYSRFFSLQSKVLDKFPQQAGVYNPAERIIPFLPGKIFFGRSQIRRVALDRMQNIDQYCKALVRLPTEISECKAILTFFEPTEDDLKPSPENVIQRSSKSDDVSGSAISDPVLLEQYIPITDYPKDGRNETSLRAGSVVEVVEKNETGWWFVNTAKGQGWVPSSYLEKATGQDNRILPTDSMKGSKYICSHHYEAQDTDEISLKKGGYVQVIEKNLDGWWLVRYQNKEGRAPSTFLSPIDSLKAKRLLKRSHKGAVQVIPNAQHASNISAVRRKAKDNAASNAQSNSHNVGRPGIARGPMGVDKNYNHVDSRNEAGNSQMKTRLFKTQLEQQLEQQQIAHNRGCQHQSSEQPYTRKYLELESDPAETESDYYEITDDWGVPSDAVYEDFDLTHANPNEPFANRMVSNESLESIGSFSSAEGEAPIETKLPPRKKTLERSITTPAQAMMATAEGEPGAQYLVMESYTNTAGDGIDLVEGESLTVLEKTDAGWWFVAGVHGEGWAPAAFINTRLPSPRVKPKQGPQRPPPPKFAKKTEKPVNQNNTVVSNQPDTCENSTHWLRTEEKQANQWKPKPKPRDRLLQSAQDNMASTHGSTEVSNCFVNSTAVSNSRLNSDTSSSPTTAVCDLKTQNALPKFGGNRLANGTGDSNVDKGLLYNRSNLNPAQKQNIQDDLTKTSAKPVLPNKKPILPGSKPMLPGSKPVIAKTKPLLPSTVNTHSRPQTVGMNNGSKNIDENQCHHDNSGLSRVNKLKHMFENS